MSEARLERVGAHVAVVTLDRPAARNAVSQALTAALAACVAEVEGDPEIRAAILTGAGTQAFCAGADLKEIAAGLPHETRATPTGGFAGFAFAPRRKFWIAAVNGAAIGGGFELVMACDMALAADHARFGLPEVQRGLAATGGGVHRLPRLVPRGLALEMIATGEPIDAARALAVGLVNRVVPADRLLAEALAIAQRVAANAPLAVAGSLALARQSLDLDEAALRAQALGLTAQLHASEDGHEGAAAFAERRAPVWRGR